MPAASQPTTNEAGAKKKDAPPPPPRLYNLDKDIGETTDVAAEHPEVVKRLKDLIAKMDADLGTKAQPPGPGVRPCGRVRNPKPLLMRIASEYD